MKKISAVIITFNEEKSISNVLKAISWCDEIIVVDSGSSDRTLEICKDFNCKLYYNPFRGFGEQKRFAVSKSNYEWVLSLDADEQVSLDLKNEIINMLSSVDEKYKAYSIPFSFYFMGKLMKWGRLNKMRHIRLFNKNFANFNTNIVHEGIEVDGEIGKLNGTIKHYSYDSVEEYFSKFNNYTSKAAELLHKQNKKSSKAKIISRLPLNFIKIYFIYGGLFDGFQGFVWALFSSLYPVVKYLKLLELYDYFT